MSFQLLTLSVRLTLNRDYSMLYDEFVEFVNMDLTEFVRAYEEKGHTLEEDKTEIRQVCET